MIKKLVCEVDCGGSRGIAFDETITLLPGQTAVFKPGARSCWYGHGFAHRQPYPLNAEEIVSGDFAVNNIQCPVWLNSNGFVVAARTRGKISASLSGGVLKVTNKSESPDATGAFEINVLTGDTLTEANKKFLKNAGWPNAAPDTKKFLGDSVFCSWTQYPRRINQRRVLQMAGEIRRNAYPCSVITIDDAWESRYGELSFNKSDFPDPAGMVAELSKMGFRTLLWATPFIDEGASTFSELSEKKFLVMRRGSDEAARLKWWGGTAGLVDLTNPRAREWYKERLLGLVNDFGVAGFKIDGGDAKYLPGGADTAWHLGVGPSGYADALLSVFEEIAPGMCETRTAWDSQRRNIVWRQGGKDSHFGLDNGLAALVSLGLHMSLLGYDIFMPDMVPGRVQTMREDDPLPTDELLVRWAEASAFFPVMQFSYFPWNYSMETAEVVRGFALMHKELEEYLGRESKDRTAPLVRPLWYGNEGAPNVQALYSVPDMFALGPSVIAAPVVGERRVSRDVALPPGRWRDIWSGETLNGGFYAAYPAPCPGAPVYVCESEPELYVRLADSAAKIKTGTIKPGVTTSSYFAGVDRDLSVTG